MFSEASAHLVHEYAQFGHPYVVGTPATPLTQSVRVLAWNRPLHSILGLDKIAGDQVWQAVLCGNEALPDYPSIASVYCGHQFGVYVPQLGDGRALTVAEIRNGSSYHQLQIKGGGQTPFSRMGDGRAVLRSSIREYVASEAMYALGIPTTRALSLMASADPVFRETTETAAVVCRVSSSFLRFGHVEYFSYQSQHTQLKDLVEWQIERFHPELLKLPKQSILLEWLRTVVIQTAKLVAQWQSVGFCHGVMNTDNMSLLGETIDYGPYGFMDDFDIDHVCNHSDHQGRYSYRNQPGIAHWNLCVLAQAMMPILGHKVEEVQSLIDEYPSVFEKEHTRLFAMKLGLTKSPEPDLEKRQQSLIEDTLVFLDKYRVDFTRFFRSIKDLDPLLDPESSFPLWQQGNFFALPLGQEGLINDSLDWLKKWIHLVDKNDFSSQSICMTNPAIVPRNHLLQTSIESAQNGRLEPLNDLLSALSDPYEEKAGYSDFYAAPPAWAKGIQLSCSS